MNVLFVYRAQANIRVKPIVDNQIRAIQKHSETTVFRCEINKGGVGYLQSLPKIRQLVKQYNINIIHAHYSVCGYFAWLALTGKPIVCSLMGSDLWDKTFSRLFLPLFYHVFWAKTIVKSKEMATVVKNATVIPNGLDFDLFKPISKPEAYKKTGYSKEKKNIIFVATDPSLVVKNLSLAKKAIQFLEESDHTNIVFHVLENKKHEELPYYFNAADLLLLTSKREGSPNVIKEALACNCKVVSTDVGDVKEMIRDMEGCYITSFDPKNIAEKIKESLDFYGDINYRSQIQWLDNKLIVKKLLNVYQEFIPVVNN